MAYFVIILKHQACFFLSKNDSIVENLNDVLGKNTVYYSLNLCAIYKK